MTGRILSLCLAGLVAIVLLAPRATSRPSAVIPSTSSLAGGGQVDQRTTGAPQQLTAKDFGLPDASTGLATSPAVTSGAPPTAVIDKAGATGRNPKLTPPPDFAGWATYYGSGSGWTGAINHRLGHVGQVVVVCGGAPFHCRTIAVVDVCACGDRSGSPTLIDLSPFAFADFAPLSRGVVRITLQVLP